MSDYELGYVSDDSRRMAVISHLGGLTPWVGIPGFVVPLVIWLMERGKDPVVERHAREALNFQLSVAIYTLCLGVLIGILAIIAIGLLLIPLLLLLWIARLILSIVGAVKANDGTLYRYPVTLRLI